MDALLLAGGYGTRLRPLTYTRPKPLLPVAGRPMLEWALDRLPDDVERVVVAVNWLADRLERHFADSDRDLEFHVVRESKPLGTAGAVKNCEQYLESDAFFVINGDIVSDMDLRAMLEQHRETGGMGTIALKEVEPAEVVNFGVARMDPDEPRRIRGFVEKPATPDQAPSTLINAGAYLLDQAVLDLIEPDRLVSMEKEIFPKLLDPGFYGWSFDGTWIDVGDPERLRAADQALRTTSRPGFEDSVVGARCTYQEATVQRCVLGDDVTLAPGTRLIDCIVGDGEHVSGEHVGERIWSRPVPAGYPAQQVGNALGAKGTSPQPTG